MKHVLRGLKISAIVIIATLIFGNLLLLAGCGVVNIQQKLYRDGTFDISIEVNSQNEMFLNGMKNILEENPVFEKAVVTETDEGYRYTLNKVTMESFYTGKGDSIFESIGIKKEFKFPYYYYTITLPNKGLEDSEYGAMAMSASYIIEPFGKIVDTNGVYTSDKKNQVKFNLLKEKNYYVTFRDFFLMAWIGGASKIVNKEAKNSSLKIDSTSTLAGTSEKISSPKRLLYMYTDEDVSLVETKGKQLANHEPEQLAFLKEYFTSTYSESYAIITPYLLSVQSKMSAVEKYDSYTEEDIRNRLSTNEFAISAYDIITDESFYSWDTENARAVIDYGNENVCKGKIEKLESKMGDWTGSDFQYKTTISAIFNCFEEVYGKKVKAIFILGDKKVTYNVDFTRYK